MKLQGFAEYPFVNGGVCAAKGFRANGICCGLRHQELPTDTAEKPAEQGIDVAIHEAPAGKKNDLAMIVSDCM